MNTKIFKDLPAWQKIMFFLMITFTSSIIFYFISIILASLMYKISFSQVIFLITNEVNENNIGIIKLFQIIQSIGTFILPSLIAYKLFFSKETNNFFINIPLSTIIYIILAILIFIPIINFIAYLNSRIDLPDSLQLFENKMKELENTAEKILKYFFIDKSFKGFIINFVMIAILAGVGEELFFRGILQNILSEWFKNKHVGIILTAAIFSFIHFQFYGFIPRFLLGVYFGYLLILSRSIWLPIVAHITNNGIAVITYYITNEEVGEGYLDKIGTNLQSDSILLIFCTIFFVLLNYVVIKTFIRRNNLESSHDQIF